jgi:hypothetical protein
MYRFLGFLIALLLVVAVVGYYRGWFHADTRTTNGHDSITVTVDKDKIERDKAGVEQHLPVVGPK